MSLPNQREVGGKPWIGTADKAGASPAPTAFVRAVFRMPVAQPAGRREAPDRGQPYPPLRGKNSKGRMRRDGYSMKIV
jgi:hypothetical protein